MKKLLCVLTVLCTLLSLSTAACAEDTAFRVSAPSGAPAIVLALPAAENPGQYTFVAADTIAAEFASGEADFIIAPVNAGARLYKNGKSSYILAAVVTWGNLFFASRQADFTAESMNGAAVTLFGENTVNASLALYALKENGIEPASVEYLAGAANTQALLLSDENAIVMTAEPALTAASFKAGGVSSVSLNSLYEKATGFNGFAQAGLFVKSETAQARPEETAAFLEEVRLSAEKCTDAPEEVAAAAVALELLPNEKVALAAIPGCAIRYLSAQDAREQVETTAQVDIAQYGGELPDDSFYYELP